MHKIKRGLDLPITGEPQQYFDGEKYTSKVALIGPDYNGMKPTMLVKVGDVVKKGEKVLEDKRNPGIYYTAPAAGKVIEINRGDKRVFLSLIIERSGHDEVSFKSFPADQLETLSEDVVRENLIDSGLWTAFRTRPFSKVPEKDAKNAAIFINAMDTNPLSFDPMLVLEKERADFEHGIKVISTLSDKVYLCSKDGSTFSAVLPAKVKLEHFSGPHPAGLSGTHINILEPVSENKSVWSIGYQDVIAVGKLFTTGKLDTTKYISIAGPLAIRPRLMKTEWGSCLDEICEGEIAERPVRIISGSVLCGRKSSENLCYLGRFHNQISLIKEDKSREFMGWQMPGFNKHSITRLFLSFTLPWKKFDMTSNTHGSPRAFVPIGNFEKVMPMDIMASPFVKSLLSNDVESAVQLGLLELDEEDLGLFNYVCPGKTDYGPLLRDMLTYIEKEG